MVFAHSKDVQTNLVRQLHLAKHTLHAIDCRLQMSGGRFGQEHSETIDTDFQISILSMGWHRAMAQ
jgi:hypothetical protein